MYCNKCGKYIDSDNRLCDECAEIERLSKRFADETEPRPSANDFARHFSSEESSQAQNTDIPGYNYFYNAENTNAQPSDSKKSSRMAGFPAALTSVILATVNYFLFIISFSLIAAELAGGIVFAVFSAPAFILSMIFGAKAISTAKKTRKSGAPMPIAPLVLGIIGLSFSALMLFILIIIVLAI